MCIRDRDKDKDQTLKDQDKDKDKDLELVLKESLRTRTRIDITRSGFSVICRSAIKYFRQIRSAYRHAHGRVTVAQYHTSGKIQHGGGCHLKFGF